MPTPRFGPGASVVNGIIYVIGGQRWLGSQGTVAYWEDLSTVEAYDPETDTWTQKADMPTARSIYTTTAMNGIIYAIGGGLNNETTTVSTVEAYDPVTDSWTKKADMLTAKSSFGIGVVNEVIYAIGGFSGTDAPRVFSTVEVYDPATDTWTTKADMPTARTGFATSVVNGRIYAVGGTSDEGPAYEGISLMEVYDPVTDTWTKATPMPTSRMMASASAVDGIIYVIGGNRIFPGVGSIMPTVEAYDTGEGSGFSGIRVQAISPLEGSPAGGEPIAMSGTNFPPDAIVTIGGKPLTDLEVINDTLLSGLTPPATPGEYNILIDSPSIDFTVFAGKFLYPTPFPPTITAITPNRGPLTGGQVATIEGSGFIPGVSVVISDVEGTVTAMTPTHITFTTPPHSEGAKFVVVRNVDRKVGFLDGGYTYIDAEFPPEDLNLDGVVDLFDLVHVASQFGLEGDHTGDVNGDGTVDLFDLVRVASHFGETAVGAAPPGVDWALNQSVSSPERVHHALAELEAMTEIPHGVVVAIEFLRAWLTNVNPPVTETKLLPNYPNPFNPETWIPYQLATDADVQVRIYDISGRAIRQLIIGHQQAGYYVSREHAVYWNGRDENGESVSSGLYFYQLRAGDYSAVKRMVIVK